MLHQVAAEHEEFGGIAHFAVKAKRAPVDGHIRNRILVDMGDVQVVAGSRAADQGKDGPAVDDDMRAFNRMSDALVFSTGVMAADHHIPSTAFHGHRIVERRGRSSLVPIPPAADHAVLFASIAGIGLRHNDVLSLPCNVGCRLGTCRKAQRRGHRGCERRLLPRQRGLRRFSHARQGFASPLQTNPVLHLDFLLNF